MGRHYVWGRKSQGEALHLLSGPYLSRAIAGSAAAKARKDGYINVIIRAGKQNRTHRETRARRLPR